MGKRVKSIFLCICTVLCLVIPCMLGKEANASDGLVVRSLNDYGVDFSNMCLADYCMFFVQDINLKYFTGHGCTGSGRSSDILNYSSLQDIAINEIEGGDNGLDCSSLVYVIGKYFGSKCTAITTSDWDRMVIGTNITAKIDAKSQGFDNLETGDVIITKTAEGGHALICVGEVNGQKTMVHIGSRYMCTGDKPESCTCCTITPGSGVTFCNSCTPNVTSGSGQNKRFIRTAAVDAYFSDMSDLDSCYIYKPIYERSLGGDYTGTNYGSGASVSTITSWITKTGTLKEEAEIVGMPGVYEFDGEPIVITGRDGLAMGDVVALTTIGSNINYGKLTVESVISTIVVGLGYVLILYGTLLILAFFFDSSNNFIDMSLMSILTFGKWRVVDDEDVKKTMRMNGKTYVTRTGVFVRAGIIWIVGIMLVSGWLLNGIAWVINKIYGWVG